MEVATRAIEKAVLDPESAPTSVRLPDEPLTPEEVATMKRHLRFLREHRRVLNLKVNAQEDLLLNERREPTHRGVCQHLLSKVDRKRVLAAAERLDPEGSMRFVEGILLIQPDVDYVLLYLDCVRRAGARAQAVAALSEALERLDFARVSQGQMRRVLDLIVELFDARQRPQVLLGLLEGEAFRRAFDGSSADLPEALANLVVPLRAAQAVVLHGKPNRHGAALLREGLRLVLHGDESALLRYRSAIRQRLLELGLQACAGTDVVATHALHGLLQSLQDNAPVHGTLGLELARRLIATEQDDEARRLLRALAAAHPSLELARRWLAVLDAPRAGRFAVRSRPRDPDGGARRRERSAPYDEARRSGMSLATMRPVWVFMTGSGGDLPTEGWAERLADLCIPGVVPLLARAELDGRPCVVVPAPGTPLPAGLDPKGGLSGEAALALAADVVAPLGALARLGLGLPDADLSRFEVDSTGRAWLVDLRGLDPANGEEGALRSAREACRALLGAARRFLPPRELAEGLEELTSFSALLRALRLG